MILSTESASGAGRVIASVAVALVFSVAWCLFLTPIHVAVRHAAGSAPRLIVDGRAQNLVAHPAAASHDITITNISEGPATVELALPIPDGQARLGVGDLSSIGGQWTPAAHGERLESTRPGSEIRLVMNAAEPEIPFLDRPDGGRVRIGHAGKQREIDLRSAKSGWHPIKLPPSRLVSVATLRANPFGTAFELFIAEADGEIAAVTIGFGAKAPIRNMDLSGGQPVSVLISSQEIVSLIFDGLGDLAVALAGALGLILAFALAGSPLVAADAQAGPSHRGWVGCFAVGFSLFALIANSAAYFVPARDSAAALAALLLVAIVLGARSRSKRAGPASIQGSPGGLPALVVAATGLGFWLSFWPLTFVGPGFIGGLQPDSSFYVTATNAIQQKSLLSAMANDGLLGYGMRSIDLALAASLSSISGLTAGRTWQIICMALMIVPPLASYYLVRDWLQSEAAASLTAVSVALCAPIASLFLESYLVQYATTAALYLNLYTALAFLRSLDRRSVSVRISLAHALTSAQAVLLYPYFAVVPVASVGVAIWMLRRDRVLLSKHLGMLASLGLVVGNIGYVFMLNHPATGQFVEALNAIARYVVFPFYDQPRFAAFLFGIAPFHAGSEMVGGLIAETSAGPFAAGLSGYFSWVERQRVIVVLAPIVASYLLALATKRRLLADAFGKLLLTSLIGYLSMLFVAGRFSGLYAQCKLAWTLATLIPVIIVPGFALCIAQGSNDRQADKRPGGWVRALAVSALSLLLAGNLIARAAGPLFWIPNPGTFAKANTAVAVDLATLDDWHPSGIPPGARFAFVDAAPSVSSPARSLRVLAGHTYSMLLGRGHVCVNCNLLAQLLEFFWFEPVDAESVDADLLVMIGDPPRVGPAGWSMALSGQRFSIYLRQRR